MITETTIRNAYVFLRVNNHTIPDETLNFMLRESLLALWKQQQDDVASATDEHSGDVR